MADRGLGLTIGISSMSSLSSPAGLALFISVALSSAWCSSKSRALSSGECNLWCGPGGLGGLLRSPLFERAGEENEKEDSVRDLVGLKPRDEGGRGGNTMFMKA